MNLEVIMSVSQLESWLNSQILTPITFLITFLAIIFVYLFMQLFKRDQRVVKFTNQIVGPPGIPFFGNGLEIAVPNYGELTKLYS